MAIIVKGERLIRVPGIANPETYTHLIVGAGGSKNYFLGRRKGILGKVDGMALSTFKALHLLERQKLMGNAREEKKKELFELLNQLHGNNAKDAAYELLELSATGYKIDKSQIVSKLFDALDLGYARDEHAQEAIGIALGSLGGEKILRKLTYRLNKSRGQPNIGIVVALGTIDSPAATSALTSFIHVYGNKPHRMYIDNWVAKYIGDSKSAGSEIPALAKLLVESGEFDGGSAVMALERTGSAAAIAPLTRALLRKTSHVRHNIICALLRLTAENQVTDELVRSELTKTLAIIVERDIEPDHKRWAARILGRVGDESVLPILDNVRSQYSHSQFALRSIWDIFQAADEAAKAIRARIGARRAVDKTAELSES